MVAKGVMGLCIFMLCSVPVWGEEGKTTEVRLARLMGQGLEWPDRQPSPTEVKIQENFQYYDVDGITLDQLRAQMKRNGTTWNDGKVYAALTTWDIRYHYDITPIKDAYVLSSIRTDVHIVFHLPRLLPSAKTPDLLITSWNSYLEHLKTHEFGHRDIAVATGREIWQALSSLGSCTDKDELERKAESLIQAKFKTLKKAQIEYDHDTNHGIKQGAVLQDPMLAAQTPQP